jgi:hypothetical protein
MEVVMRKLLALVGVLVVVATACGRLGDDAGSGGIAYPTGADDVVLQVSVGGGFVMPTYALTAFPSFSLYGDGRLITVGPQIEIYPGPALPSLWQQTLTPEAVAALLEEARAAGVFDDLVLDDFCGVADVGTTTIVAVADGVRHTSSVYALGMDTAMCQDDVAARERLTAFVNRLGDLSWLPAGSVGDPEPYAFDAIAILAEPYGEGDPTLPQQEVAWPLATFPGAFAEIGDGLGLRCGTVTRDDLATLRPLLEQANQLTPWTADGETFRLTLRPLLPDEPDCSALGAR